MAFQERIVDIIEITPSLKTEVKSGLVFCPVGDSNVLELCSHKWCKKAIVGVCDEKGNYVPASGRTRIPCTSHLNSESLRMPVGSDGLGSCRIRDGKGYEAGNAGRELGFILALCEGGEVDIFTTGSTGYF